MQAFFIFLQIIICAKVFNALGYTLNTIFMDKLLAL